mgnify:CR=1 FL=1
MKVRTLIILSVLFFALGSLGGAAYAFVSGDAVLVSVAAILPTPKTAEEKLIDDFIETQEKKQQTENKQSDNTQKNDDSDAQQDSQPKNEPSNEAPKADTSKNTEKRTGQPTVSDGKTLRVRSLPDLKEGKVLIGIANTETVEIVDEKNGWYQIITSNGTKGWVSKEYMKEL